MNIGLVAFEELGSDLDVVEAQPAPQDSAGNGGNGGNGNGRTIGGFGSSSGYSRQDHPMTDAQRRYLFRLLAERGIERDKVRERLHEALGVEELSQATKYGASKLIDMIQRDQAPKCLTQTVEA